MKKIIFCALAIATFISCNKETNEQESLGDATVNISINVNKMLTRAVEGGHDGVDDEKVAPKIFTVTVLSYNSSATLLGTVDLTAAQVKDAVWGNYRNMDGSLGAQVTKATGATVGLPKGATHIDVVVNRPATGDYSLESNVNYFNYRNNTNGANKKYPFGDDNFDRTILTTKDYGVGTALTGLDVSAKVPTYTMGFSVTPYFSRMEVFGGINVDEAAEWTDGYNNKWRTMTVDEYKAVTTDEVPSATGHYKNGAVKGTAENGFDVNTVYIPEYYWFLQENAVADPVKRTALNAYETEADVEAVADINAAWVRQPHYAATTNQVTWLPNRYYAVDVESIFINNIKVRGSERTPYLHPWPGNQVATGWQDWYKAFHSFNWHSAGSSIGNTFLCMGNMWDRIADSDKYKDVVIPETEGNTKMQIIDGKAKPIAEISKFYGNQSRNIGIIDNKASAYVFYSQSKTATTSATNAESLRGELPHIVLKLKAYSNSTSYAAGTYVAGKEFITISLFSDAVAGAGNYITSFKGGYIYRFDMNNLKYAFIGDVPVPGGKPADGKDPKDPVDPDPEMPGSQLIMNVQVLPWTIQNIYPSI